ncbi:unnamed protein product [Phytomonas sp. Hart1]|nr:unnamed protein product [Phytomonas sp. Hart1]|eukprot:CCW66061.1 unnamed protein product [Phytomonas sp. isolate Hart1]
MNIPQPRHKNPLMEELDFLKNVQEDRMSFHASLACHERCVGNYWLNKFYWKEKSCMQNCLEKINQATIITNLNYERFQQIQNKK